jgi:hypothetical protein
MIKPSKSRDRVQFHISEAPPPGHYKADESFRRSQLKKLGFFTSKRSFVNVAE